jgi:hypothetical protein
MPQEVEITRTLLPAPIIGKPDRQVYQIQYRVGLLPPRFVYIEKDDWTEAVEKKAIQADIKKALETQTTKITI